jgi:sialate O-acetylesterase
MTRLLSIFLLSAIPVIAPGQVILPRLLSDGAVLQRDAKLKIWGWASPGERVTLTFADKTYMATTDANQEWSIVLPSQPAGGPFQLTFKGKNEITVSNVVFGDVWVCSGQSNMELTMQRVQDRYPNEIAASENPMIRHFTVPDEYDFKKPNRDVSSGSWETANPKNVRNFSAVGYFFARKLFEKYGVPIGLVNAALGGSPVEAWMSENVIRKFPEDFEEYIKFQDDDFIRAREEKNSIEARQWIWDLNQRDPGLSEKEGRWYSNEIDDSEWNRIQLPQLFPEPQTQFSGSLWFRKTIEVPGSMAGKPASLWMGRIIDQDSIFVNGQFVGWTSYQYPPRKYTVPAGVLRKGNNVIAIRVIVQSGRGGFVPDKPYFLAVANDTVDLKGEWKFREGASVNPMNSFTFTRWKPVGLFNKMIAPLTEFRIKGVIWYQGESNANAPEDYSLKLSEMIGDWRARWSSGTFPFLFVQLPNFMEPKTKPAESNWARLRQQQLETLVVPATGMAVAIDLGEWNDIHPLNKKDVGERLALLARSVAYKERGIMPSGPIAISAKFGFPEAQIRFANAQNGLVAKGQVLKGFEVSEDGKTFFIADARIRGNEVVVSSVDIKSIVAIRYAWADNPSEANLYNKEGLPASPFELKK